MMVPLDSSVPIIHDSVTLSQHDLEIEAAELLLILITALVLFLLWQLKMWMKRGCSHSHLHFSGVQEAANTLALGQNHNLTDSAAMPPTYLCLCDYWNPGLPTCNKDPPPVFIDLLLQCMISQLNQSAVGVVFTFVCVHIDKMS